VRSQTPLYSDPLSVLLASTLTASTLTA